MRVHGRAGFVGWWVRGLAGGRAGGVRVGPVGKRSMVASVGVTAVGRVGEWVGGRICTGVCVRGHVTSRARPDVRARVQHVGRYGDAYRCERASGRAYGRAGSVDGIVVGEWLCGWASGRAGAGLAGVGGGWARGWLGLATLGWACAGLLFFAFPFIPALAWLGSCRVGSGGARWGGAGLSGAGQGAAGLGEARRDRGGVGVGSGVVVWGGAGWGGAGCSWAGVGWTFMHVRPPGHPCPWSHTP